MWKAYVHLEPVPNSRGPLRDLGVVDLLGDALEHAHVRFSLEGEPTVGLIECIDPTDWQERPGFIPTVHISLPRIWSRPSDHNRR